MKTLFLFLLVVVLAAGGYVLVMSGGKIPDLAELKVIAHLDPKAVSTKASAEKTKLPPLAAVPAPTKAPRVETIRLKNGKTVVGQVVIRGVDAIVIRTADGKSMQVALKDVKR